MNEITANVNNAHCMVTKSHIGYDTILNVCSGRAVNVDWTVLDWIGNGFLVLFIMFIAFIFIGLFYSIMKGY